MEFYFRLSENADDEKQNECKKYDNVSITPTTWFFDLQEERRKNVKEYENKPKLDITETNEYTHWTAWAHTIPDEKIINIRPPEFIDYNLTVLPHEIVHNYFKNLSNESYVTQIAQSPIFNNYIKDCFRYCRH
ncbi:hypothetical protein HYZ41_01030 [archaeon]|nr:hypothetical protein [archaeon]